MAALTPSLKADSHTVPEWVERNAQLFRACPAGVQRSRGGTTSKYVIRAGGEEEEEQQNAACMAAMLMDTESGVGWIEAPAGTQPASYYRDLSNHPNILATFVYTARRRAGFLPDVTGQQLSSEQWDDYVNKFNAWLNELDAFFFYLRLVDQQGDSIPNLAGTSDAIVDALSNFVLKSANEAEEETKKEITQRIKTSFELAAEYMVEKNITTTTPTQVVKAGFQHEAFPSVGPSNPQVPISFTITTLSKSKENPNSSSTIQYGTSASMNRFTFQLNSANIIANAEALSKGTTLLSTKTYVDYINGPLDEWAEGGNVLPTTNK